MNSVFNNMHQKEATTRLVDKKDVFEAAKLGDVMLIIDHVLSNPAVVHQKDYRYYFQKRINNADVVFGIILNTYRLCPKLENVHHFILRRTTVMKKFAKRFLKPAVMLIQSIKGDLSPMEYLII